MSKSRAALCDILNSAIATFEEIEDYENDPVETNSIGSYVSREGTSEIVTFDEETTILRPGFGDGNNAPTLLKSQSSKKAPKDKPKRPLSAYNLYFQYEREHIISGAKERPSSKELLAMLQAKDNRQRPQEKRKHRKTHGKVSFGNLARSIADKWKMLDEETKAVFKNEANQEKIRYKQELAEWTKNRNEEIKQMTVTPPCPIEENFPHSVLKSSSKKKIHSPIETPFAIARNQQLLRGNKHWQDDGRLHGELNEQSIPSASRNPFSSHYDFINDDSTIFASRLYSGEYGRDRVIRTHQDSYYMPFVGCAHRQPHSMLPMTIDRFQGTFNGNLSHSYYSMVCHTDEFHRDDLDHNHNAHVDYEPIEYVPRKPVNDEA